MKKRLLALVLCLVMVVGLLPTVFAADGTEAASDTYTVTFDTHGGTPIPGQQVVAKGGKIEQPSNPTKEGYTFAGWYTDAAYTSAWDFDWVVSDNVWLHAKWTYTYTVTFNANGGTGTMDPQQLTEGQSVQLNASTFTREGYTFLGWNTNKDADAKLYDDCDYVFFGAATTLYAIWKQNPTNAKLSYDLGGGTLKSGSYTKPGQVAVGAAITVPTASEVSYDGYTLEGWYTSPIFMDSTKWTGTTMPAEDLTLYANYTKDAGKYTVTFEGNGSTSGYTYPQAFTAGEAFYLSANLYKRDGYTFLGWATRANATRATYADKERVRFSTDLTLYAVWQKNSDYTLSYYDYDDGNYTLRFEYGNMFTVDPNGGTVTFEGSIFTTARTYTVSKDYRLPDAKRVGYTFYGWDYSYNYRTGIVTLTAMWSKSTSGCSVKYWSYDYNKSMYEYVRTSSTITIDPNGGSVTWYGTTISKKQSVTVFDDRILNDATWKGNTFYGWKLTYSGSTPVFTAMWMQTSSIPSMLNGVDHYAYIKGYPNGTFKPTATITRAEVATIFYRLLNTSTRNAYSTSYNTFTDVPSGAWYNTAVSTMAKLGIINGDANGKFRPADPITRAELAAMVARCDGRTASVSSIFSDTTGHWASSYIARAYELGWITGYGTTYAPDKYISRAETVAILNRVLEREPEYTSDLLKNMNTFSDVSTTAWYYLDVQEAANSHTYTRKTNSNYETWSKLTADPSWF